MKINQKIIQILRNKRLALFTLDALVGVVLVLIFIILSNTYIVRSEADTLPDLQLGRTAQDIIAVMDYDMKFDSFNKKIIRNEIQEWLPIEYNMSVNVTLDNGSSIQTDEIDFSKDFVASGKRFIVINNSGMITHFGEVRYWIWSK